MYDDIPYDHLTIPIGGTFTTDWYVDDALTGQPADFVGWSARMEIRDSFDDALLATLTTDGTGDGDIVLFTDGSGNVVATLPGSFTASLAPTVTATFDLKITDSDGAPWRSVEGRVRITQEVTTDG